MGGGRLHEIEARIDGATDYLQRGQPYRDMAWLVARVRDLEAALRYIRTYGGLPNHMQDMVDAVLAGETAGEPK